ncbi:MAG: Gfo/Idh/MocA family oxidoreductase [Clostridiales bacterium]|jgi:myo-inositol 2-dehydrogenase/D-chiro-inositol 1-dehydrogenase|nr:Gfo/Idh/MocA family oxidoreductase [Clostridiales bacterium]
MEEIRIGVIGTGAIGQEHVARLHNTIAGARVTAVCDINTESALTVASKHGLRVEPNMDSLIAANDVDAIVVCCYDPVHAKAVLDSISKGKPVFCEKPLATTRQDCKKIVDAEIAAGKRLVQVGFQRRYDKGYLQIKELIDSGDFGRPLMAHCAHRNASVADNYDTTYAVYSTAIHEIDAVHWLIDDEYVSAQVIIPSSTKYTRPDFLKDPQFMILRTAKGVLIDIEVFVNCRYGYDIQCEIICEDGILKLPEPSFPMVRKNERLSTRLETDWKRRFIEAYDVEMQDWVNSALKGEVNGPTAWDGYVAAVTADALVRSQTTGEVVDIITGSTPDFYK